MLARPDRTQAGRTPREIVAQALDYAAWVEMLSAEDTRRIYERLSGGGVLDEDFREHFGTDLDPEAVNHAHQIVIVASELDDSTERILAYLDRRGLAVNALFLEVFESGSEQLLSRAWLIDPGATQSNVAAATTTRGQREPWNGEFYVSFGPLEHRSWDDALEYGFVSAGGGSWYSQTLRLLSPGDRIWVKIPKTGYVGVGVVVEAVSPITTFTVPTPKGDKPVIEVLQHADRYRPKAADPEKTEYFVRVRWLDTVRDSEAVNEAGLFANQNTVCRPTAPKWRHTIDRLKTHFPKWEG